MTSLSFLESQRLLKKYDIPFANTEACNSKKQAVAFAKKIGYPIVLKIASSDILHKTELGLVKLGINNEKDLKKYWDEILTSVKRKRGKSEIEGILVQKQLFGKQIVLGMKRDLSFGPVLMFGLGGIFIEVLKDVVFRVTPIDKKEAKKMIKEIKALPILKGFRGEKPINIERIIEIIVNFSKLSLNEEKIKEIDLNPIIINEKEALVVDACFLV